MLVVSRLQVHQICSRWRVRRKQLRLDRTIRELGMFDTHSIDHKSFNIMTILFFK